MSKHAKRMRAKAQAKGAIKSEVKAAPLRPASKAECGVRLAPNWRTTPNPTYVSGKHKRAGSRLVRQHHRASVCVSHSGEGDAADIAALILSLSV